ncbi:MAG: hypothetical protein IJ058_07855 [Lachnospiraceae bacterium]|nr:hypothetical protein [Lachnospiraceae bacterium]
MKKFKVKIKSALVGAVTGVAIVVALLCVFGFDSKQDDDASGRYVESLEDGTVIEAYAAAPAPEFTERLIEYIDADKDYLKDLSEEELVELSREALDASGKNTSLADGDLKTTGITFELPEGFMASEDTPGMYVLKRYPIDASNIRYIEMNVDYTLQLMDESYFEEMLEEMLESGYGSAVDVNISEFKHITIDSVPAVRVKTEYDLEENHITQLIVAINGSRTYMLIYTQTHDYDRMDEFETSVASIHVSK